MMQKISSPVSLLLCLTCLHGIGFTQQVDIPRILERADKLLEEAKAGYESARSSSSVDAFIDAGFKLEEARIKYLVLQEIGTAEQQKAATDRLRAVQQLTKLLHDGQVALSGTRGDAPSTAPPAAPAAPPIADPGSPPAARIMVDVTRRAPAPDAARQRDSETLIRNIFKDQYTRKAPADRRFLARQLLDQAARSHDDLVAQWVLYREAQDIAIQGCDPKTAIEAIEGAARSFDIDVLSMKSQALTSAGKLARTPEELTSITDALILLVEDLVRADQYDAADKAAGAALALARKGTDLALATRVALRARDVVEAKAQFQGLRRVLETLAKTPDDGPSNAEMGRYLCFVKGSWDVGLRFMMKGSDGVLKSLAGKEVALPTQPAERMAIADGWYDLGEKEKSQLRRSQMHHHAKGLYESALTDASALVRTRIEKRLETLQFIGALPGQPGGPGSGDITTLIPKKALVGFGTLEINSNLKGNSVLVGGKECRKYIFAHPPSTLIYDIPSGCRLFLATGAKLDRNAANVTGSWKYLVIVDGRLLHESKPLNEFRDFELEISVALPAGARELQLKIDELRDYTSDWAVWAYPRFQK